MGCCISGLICTQDGGTISVIRISKACRKCFAMKLFTQQRGDTIVEVLLAVAMLAFVVTTASATSTRSTGTVRASQERGEALKIAQSQVEYIIANKGLDDGKECYNSAGDAKDADDKECAYQSGAGSGCDVAVASYCYNVTVDQEQTGSQGPNDPSISMSYNVRVNWDSVNGNTDTLNIVYKMLVRNPSYVPPAPPPPVATDDDVGIDDNDNPEECAATNTCPPFGKYGYRRAFNVVVVRLQPGQTMASCEWYFGHGTPERYNGSSSSCTPGNKLSHPFPEVPGQPDGGNCTTDGNFTKARYPVTMTVITNTGRRVPGNTVTASVPYCNP